MRKIGRLKRIATGNMHSQQNKPPNRVELLNTFVVIRLFDSRRISGIPKELNSGISTVRVCLYVEIEL